MKDKKERGSPPVKARPAPTTNPKESRSEDSMKKALTIQGAISEFAELDESMAIPPLTRFVLFLEKREFLIIHKSDIAHVPVKYLAFESRLK